MNSRSAIIILIFLFAIGCGQNKKTNESNCNHHVGHDMLGNEYPMHTGVRAQYDTLILKCQELCHLCAHDSHEAYKGKDVNLDSLVMSARTYAEDIKAIAQDAKALISPSDTSRYQQADIIMGSADDIMFYLDMYRKGEGIGYIDKAEVFAGHAWTFCLDALIIPDIEK